MTHVVLPASIVELAARKTINERIKAQIAGEQVDPVKTKACRWLMSMAALAGANNAPDQQTITLSLEHFSLIGDNFIYPKPLPDPADSSA